MRRAVPKATWKLCHPAERFTMNAVQTVNFNTGPVCGTVVTIVIR